MSDDAHGTSGTGEAAPPGAVAGLRTGAAATQDGSEVPREQGPVGVWRPGLRTLTAGLILIVTVVATEALAVATVMPLVEEDLGDLWLYGWVFTGFFLGNLLGIVTAGRAADRVPLVVPFAVGLVLFGSGLVVAGVAPSMVVLVAGRVLQGAGAGALPAAAYVAIGRAYPPTLRPRMFALLSTAWVVPGVAAPALAGVVGEHLGWRWVFLAILPVVAVAGGLAGNAVRKVPPPAERVDPPADRGSLLLAVGLAAGAAMVVAGLGAERPGVGAALLVAGGALTIWALRRLTPPGTLRARPGLPAAVALRGLLTYAFFSVDVFVSYAVTTVREGPTLLTGLVLTSATLAWTAGAWIQERQVARLGPRVLERRGLLVFALGAAGLVVVLHPAVPAALAIVAFGICGLGMGQAYAPLSLSVLAAAEPSEQGNATASLQLCDVLGVALGSGVAGALVAFGDGADWPAARALALVFGASILVAVGGAFLARRLPASVVDA